MPIEVDHEMLRRLGGICYMRVKDCPAFNRVYSAPTYSRDEVLEEVNRRGLGSATVLSQNVRHLRTSCATLTAAYKTIAAEEREKMEALYCLGASLSPDVSYILILAQINKPLVLLGQ